MYRAFFEDCPDGLCCVDPSGVMLACNPKFAQMVGLDREDIVGRLSFDLLTPEDQERARGFLKEFWGSGEVSGLELPLRHSDGHLLYTSISATPLRDDVGEISYALAVVRDVSDRKPLELALQASEARFRTIYEHAPIMVDAFDADGRCVLWNPECERQLGWTNDEIMSGLDILSVAYPEPQELERVRQVIKGADGVFRENRPLAKDGTQRTQMWANFPMPDGTMIAAGFDITDRKAAEVELEASEARFRQLAEKLNFIPWEADPDTWTVTYVGPQAGAITGYPAEEWVKPGFWPVRLVHPADQDKALDALLTGLANKDDFQFEYRMVTAGGDILWVRTFVSVVRDDDGIGKIVRGVTIDVTERREAEEEQAFLLRELDHRVKNMLATVESVAQQTVRSAAGLEDFSQSFSGRVRALGRIHQVLSREDGLQHLNVPQLIALALGPFSEPQRGRVSIDGDEVWVPISAVRPLVMALYELGTNALKYGALSVPDGRVSIGCHRSDSGYLGIEWTEEGGPTVENPQSHGVGTSVIEEGLPYELGAKVILEFPASGVRCRIKVPTGAASEDAGEGSVEEGP